MKIFKHLLFISIFVVGFSMTATAQRNDDQKRPPKDPPKINPEKKDPPKNNPPKNNPGNDNRGKKPNGIIYIGGNQTEIGFS